VTKIKTEDETMEERRIVNRVLLLVPVNTVANWNEEFTKWTEMDDLRFPRIDFHCINSGDAGSRQQYWDRWSRRGGVLIVSFELFARMYRDDKTPTKKAPTTPDVMVIDEAHLVFSGQSTKRFSTVEKLETRIRIGLTGTPLQNNLMEYYRMASWVKPNCLGTPAEFKNAFMRPITEGMTTDAGAKKDDIYRNKSIELHELLAPFVHRRGVDLLKEHLPPMQQAVIHVRQTKFQSSLYSILKKVSKENGKGLLETMHKNRIIGAHPSFVLGEGDSDEKKDFSKIATRYSKSTTEISHSGKCELLVEIIAHSVVLGDKIVVFSQCLKSLNFIEELLQRSNWENKLPALKNLKKKYSWGPWKKGIDYLRIDGATSSSDRGNLITSFNEEQMEEKKLFLISTRAGGIGVNLVAANRVILFDSNWNPAVDLQALHRCYRFGQKKPVFVYRFLTEGAMEETIYARSVNKSALANRIVDQKFPEKHFSQDELDRLMDNQSWVQCDLCDKWRVLPYSEDGSDLPDTWHCSMNTLDPDHATCDAEELNKEEYIDYFAKKKNALTAFESTDNWVQCNICKKWRALPDLQSWDKLPEEWDCTMNALDPDHASCNAKEMSQRDYIDHFAKKKAALADGGSIGYVKTTKSNDQLDAQTKTLTEHDPVLKWLVARRVNEKGKRKKKHGCISRYYFHECLLGEEENFET